MVETTSAVDKDSTKLPLEETRPLKVVISLRSSSFEERTLLGFGLDRFDHTFAMDNVVSSSV